MGGRTGCSALPIVAAVFFRKKTKTMEFVREERIVRIFVLRNSYEGREILYSYKKFLKVKTFRGDCNVYKF